MFAYSQSHMAAQNFIPSKNNRTNKIALIEDLIIDAIILYPKLNQGPTNKAMIKSKPFLLAIGEYFDQIMYKRNFKFSFS